MHKATLTKKPVSVRVGDEVQSIDGQHISSVAQAKRLVRGEELSIVTLQVCRRSAATWNPASWGPAVFQGPDIEVVTLQRRTVALPAAPLRAAAIAAAFTRAVQGEDGLRDAAPAEDSGGSESRVEQIVNAGTRALGTGAPQRAVAPPQSLRQEAAERSRFPGRQTEHAAAASAAEREHVARHGREREGGQGQGGELGRAPATIVAGMIGAAVLHHLMLWTGGVDAFLSSWSPFYFSLGSPAFRLAPITSWPRLFAGFVDSCMGADSIFRSSPILATVASLVAIISGISVLNTSGILKPLARLPPPPKFARPLLRMAAAWVCSAAMTQEWQLDCIHPCLTARRLALSFSHVGQSALGLGGAVLFWYSLRQAVVAAGAGREAERRWDNKMSLLMTAHVVALLTVHVCILTSWVDVASARAEPALPAADGDVAWPWATNCWRWMMGMTWRLMARALRVGVGILLSVVLDLVGQAAEVQLLSKVARAPLALVSRLVRRVRQQRWALVALAYIAMGTYMALPLAPSALKALLQQLSASLTSAAARISEMESGDPAKSPHLATLGLPSPGGGVQLIRLGRIAGASLASFACRWAGGVLQAFLDEGPVSASVASKLACAGGGGYLFSELVQMTDSRQYSRELFAAPREARQVLAWLLGAYIFWYVPFSPVQTPRVCLGLSCYLFGVGLAADCAFGPREETHLFNLGARLMARALKLVFEDKPWSCVGGTLIYVGAEVVRWSMGAESLVLAAGLSAASESLHLEAVKLWWQVLQVAILAGFCDPDTRAGALFGMYCC